MVLATKSWALIVKVIPGKVLLLVRDEVIVTRRSCCAGRIDGPFGSLLLLLQPKWLRINRIDEGRLLLLSVIQRIPDVLIVVMMMTRRDVT